MQTPGGHRVPEAPGQGPAALCGSRTGVTLACLVARTSLEVHGEGHSVFVQGIGWAGCPGGFAHGVAPVLPPGDTASMRGEGKRLSMCLMSMAPVPGPRGSCEVPAVPESVGAVIAKSCTTLPPPCSVVRCGRPGGC